MVGYGLTELAMAFGVPEEVIGLSIVALGTSASGTSDINSRGLSWPHGFVRRQRAREQYLQPVWYYWCNGITDTAAIFSKNYAVRLVGPFNCYNYFATFLLKHRKLYRLVGVIFLIAYISFITCQFAGMNGTMP